MKNNEFVSYKDALEIVFANRNRAYGAYQLRRQYPAALTKAFTIGLILIGLFLVFPQLVKAFAALMPVEEKKDEIYVMTTVEIATPPPPIIPKTPPPPAKALQQFTPPIVEEDDKVPDEPPKLSNDQLLDNKADIGAKNVEGPTEGPPTLDDPINTGLVETPVTNTGDDPMEFYSVQKPPSFPGGEKELFKYLSKNIIYPAIARENNIQGTVVLSFVVGRDGSVAEVSVLKDLGGGCTKEALRVVTTMPKWIPGESNGKTVKVRYTLPVRFVLN
ncbi:MAG: TonB family protein [Saprospiraceae bacterium]|nr:TonB family protein [Saprospiraceae bacterium]